MSKPKAQEPVGFLRDETAPRLVQAAALTLAILKYLGTPSLADLDKAIRRRDERVVGRARCLVLDAEDEALLADRELAPVMWLLQVGSSGKVSPRPGVRLAVCSDCDAWSLVDDPKPVTCYLTDSCRGKAKAVPAAEKAPEPEGQTLAEIAAGATGSDPHTEQA